MYFERQIKASVKSIRMPEDMMDRIIGKTTLKATRVSRGAGWKRAVAAAAAVCCILVAVPALTAAVEPVYELMYGISPSVAQFFKPVKRSDTDNGIRLEVVSAHIHGDTAEIYITLKDLSGERIDGTTDLYDSYTIRRAFDSSAYCRRLWYDSETRAVGFLITITTADGSDITDNKVTFTVDTLLSHKSEHKQMEIAIDLSEIKAAERTQSVHVTGGGGQEYNPNSFAALVPIAPAALPVEGVELTGITFSEGRLHIQTRVTDKLERDNHGYLYLISADGTRIDFDASYHFALESTGTRVDYIEYVFAVSQEELAEYRLFGDFWITDMVTHGSWSVTFSIGG